MKFCFRHYLLNCPLCFPASTAPKAVSTNTSSIAASNPTTGTSATTTVAADIPTTGTSATTTVAADIPTTGISAPTNVASTNNVVGSSLAQGSNLVATSNNKNPAIPRNSGVKTTIVAASNPTAGSLAAIHAPFPFLPPPSPQNGTIKRKSTPGAPVKRRKRFRKTVIDDDVACQIFRSLRLPNQFLNSGKVLAWALQPDDPAFVNIHNYVAVGQEHGFGVKVVSILRIVVKTDDVDIVPFNNDPDVKGKNRMMLWHGTKRCALPSILQNSLRLPASRYQMFGPGIYFADRVSKSCQYCDHGQSHYAGSRAYLFLCDVLLGNVHKAYRSDWSLKSAPNGCDSVQGCGSNVPAPEWNQTIDGCVWPIGPTVKNKEDISPSPGLLYNEYIVYNTKQVQPKYLVKIEFAQKPVVEILD